MRMTSHQEKIQPPALPNSLNPQKRKATPGRARRRQGASPLLLWTPTKPPLQRSPLWPSQQMPLTREHSDNKEIVYDCSNEDSCAHHPAVVPPEDPSAPATPCPLSSSIGEPTEAAMTPKVSRSSPSAPTATGTNDPSHNLLPRRQCRHGGGTEMPTKAPEKDSAKKVAPLTAAVFLHTPIAGAPPATR